MVDKFRSEGIRNGETGGKTGRSSSKLSTGFILVLFILLVITLNICSANSVDDGSSSIAATQGFTIYNYAEGLHFILASRSNVGLPTPSSYMPSGGDNHFEVTRYLIPLPVNATVRYDVFNTSETKVGEFTVNMNTLGPLISGYGNINLSGPISYFFGSTPYRLVIVNA
ncbi:hypothetical protein SAMN05444162_2565 [Paenibacillaceae bacterium GAS479]|nr:hypothetical protein SAMN05444162_2565 [Paenibacillaceae bacterium GAS479]